MTTGETPLQKRNRHKTKILYHTLALLGVGCLFSLFVVLVQPFDSINLWLSDQLFTSESPSPNVAIAGIDDDTLGTFGKWSEWPRRLHAQAIDNLSKAGAKVIGYDVLFVDDSTDDQVLAAAMANASNVVLAAAGTELMPDIDSELAYGGFLFPTPPLEQASNGIGHANLELDHDGKVRRLPLLVRDDLGNTIPSFSLAVLYTNFSMPLPSQFPVQDHKLRLFARDVPVDSTSRLRINFATDYETQPYISYGDIISGNFDRSLVKNRIVLIGMTATGEPDSWSVPISDGKIPGVLIHATAIDTVLRQRFLTEAGSGITMLVLLLMLSIAALALPRLGLRWGMALLAGLFIGYLAIAFLSFDKGLVLGMLYPLSLLPTLFVSSVVCLIVMGQSDKRFVRDLFGRYVSPQVAKEILNSADTGHLRLGGETRDVTVLFADIRNYTVMSERMSPEAIVNMLNTYLSVIIDRVLQNGGMVNKFAGDNIMAVWNAPELQPEHARLAAKAAWESQQAFATLHQSDPSLPKVQFGIGINSGAALAGNVGSVGRAEYTVIGDTVNLASRICSGTPGGEVYVGPETYRQAKDHLEVEELAPQTFKGKAEQVTVYKVTGCK